MTKTLKEIQISYDELLNKREQIVAELYRLEGEARFLKGLEEVKKESPEVEAEKIFNIEKEANK